VTVDEKVKRVAEVETVGTGKKRQDVIIADGDGTAKVSLWEEHIRELRNNICYNLKTIAQEWGGRKYLSIRNSRISCIADIGDINEAHEMKKSSSMSSRMYRLLRCVPTRQVQSMPEVQGSSRAFVNEGLCKMLKA